MDAIGLGIIDTLPPIVKHLSLTVIILTIATVISSGLRKLMNRFIKRKAYAIHVDPTSYNFFKNASSSVIYLIALIMIFNTIPPLKHLGTTLLAGAGILAAAVGFASQAAFSNIVGGVFIILSRPFRVGDTISLDTGLIGQVEDITLRHTVIRDIEFRRIVIPNSTMNTSIIVNSTIVNENVRQQVDIGISYDSDIEHASRIIKEEAVKLPQFIDGRSQEEIDSGAELVMVKLTELGDFAVNLRAYVWARGHLKAFELKCELLKAVKNRFDREGIEIPFPYRTLVFKKDLMSESNQLQQDNCK